MAFSSDYYDNAWHRLGVVAREMHRQQITEANFIDIPPYQTKRLGCVRQCLADYTDSINILRTLSVEERVESLSKWYQTFQDRLTELHAKIETEKQNIASGEYKGNYPEMRVHRIQNDIDQAKHDCRVVNDVLNLKGAMQTLLPAGMVGALDLLSREQWIQVYIENPIAAMNSLELEC